jgi:hypothetical protein
MLVNQDGLYATCRRGHILGPLFIDHDHACCNKKWTCGKCVPGLLCGYRNCWLIDVELERNHHKHSGHWWSAAVAYLCDRGCDPADQERLVAHVEIHRQGRVGWRGRRPEGVHYFNHETDARAMLQRCSIQCRQHCPTGPRCRPPTAAEPRVANGDLFALRNPIEVGQTLICAGQGNASARRRLRRLPMSFVPRGCLPLR